MRAMAAAEVDENIKVYRATMRKKYGDDAAEKAGLSFNSPVSGYGKKIGFGPNDAAAYKAWLDTQGGDDADSGKAAWSKVRDLAISSKVSSAKMISYNDTKIKMNVDDAPIYEPALSAMQSVHGLKMIPEVTVRTTGRVSGLGTGGMDGVSGAYGNGGIQVNRDLAKKEGAAIVVHEMAHHLDYEALLPSDAWDKRSASERKGDKKVKRLMDALGGTQARQDLVKQYKTVSYRGTTKVTQINQFVGYLATPPETFARAYEQYVAVRGDNAEYKKQFEQRRKNSAGTPGTFWDDDDFAPVVLAMDDLFEDWDK